MSVGERAAGRSGWRGLGPALCGLVLALALGVAPALAGENAVGSFTTHVSPHTVAIGSSFHDTALLTPGGGSEPGPQPTGTVTFFFYPPSDPTCVSEDGIFSSRATVDPATGTARSPDFTPTRKGDYHVIAVYSGDRYYAGDSTSCGDPGESAHVVQPIQVTGGGGATPPPPTTPGPPTPPTPPTPPIPPPPPTGPPSGPAGSGGAGAQNMPLIATAMLLSSSSANLGSTVDPHGLPTTVHFEYSWAGAVGAFAAAIVYQSRTPEQSVGADFADHTVTAIVKGLLPNSRYHLRAVARNAAGTTFGVDTVFRTAEDPPPPPPVLGKAFNVQPITGAVRVLTGRGKGAHFMPLTEPRQLPVGSVLDTTTGTARLTTATAKRGQTQAGTFGAGIFKVLQNRRQLGLAQVSLVVSPKASKLCIAAGKAHTAAAKRKLPKSLLALLHATAKGRFSTTGRFSSATVRGTTWTTAERCDGTLTLVKRGVVVVTDLRRRRSIVLRAGQSYLAKAP